MKDSTSTSPMLIWSDMRGPSFHLITRANTHCSAGAGSLILDKGKYFVSFEAVAAL